MTGLARPIADRYLSVTVTAEGVGTLNLQGRIEALAARHQALEQRIFDEDHRPSPDPEALGRLKAEKLRLKDELERLRASP